VAHLTGVLEILVQRKRRSTNRGLCSAIKRTIREDNVMPLSKWALYMEELFPMLGN
jgi:hypothetical protein